MGRSRLKNNCGSYGEGAVNITKETIDDVIVRDGFTDCWHWAFSRLQPRGYGQVRFNGKNQLAHRVIYVLLVGPIEPGLELDHLCRNRGCVNPAHLEPVTHRVNGLRGISLAAQNARKTHCKSGHEFTPDNILWQRNKTYPTRVCRECTRLAAAKRYAKRCGRG